MISLEIVRGRSDRTLCPHDDIKAHTAAVSVRLAELSKRSNHDADEDLDDEADPESSLHSFVNV